MYSFFGPSHLVVYLGLETFREKHLKNDKFSKAKVTPLYKEGLYSLYSLHVGLWQHLCFSHLGWWCQEGVPWHPHLIVSPLH